jgi:alanine racemase
MRNVPTWVEINLDNLISNVSAIKKIVRRGVRILLTIKADAYGHGAVQVARAVEDSVHTFGVATLDEAKELKQDGIKTQILILNPILEAEIPEIISSGFAVSTPSFHFATLLSDGAQTRNKKINIHIEVDTGMGRAGINEEEAGEEIVRISKLPGINIGGVYTHFPVSDSDLDYSSGQIGRFLQLIMSLKERGIDIPVVHCANSCALAALPDSHMDLVRPGLLIYGHLSNGTQSKPQVKPVMTWKSRLVQVRRIPKGKTISYGRTFTTERDTVMGVVPVGYGHGYPFQLSNSGWMLVRGKRVPVIGRVTMDMTMVDLTELEPPPAVGDEVVLIGHQGKENISLLEVAGWANTIPYVVLCGISKRVPRAYVRAGKIEVFKTLLGVIPANIPV